MEQQRSELVVDAGKFKALYYDETSAPLTHDQNQIIFGSYYALDAAGTPMLDPKAFEDPRCATRYEYVKKSIAKAQAAGDTEPKLRRSDARAILASKLIVSALVLSYFGSAAYEWRDLEDKSITNIEGYAGAAITGAIRYIDNYENMIRAALGKPTEAELRAKALAASTALPTPDISPSAIPKVSTTPKPSPSPSESESSIGTYPVVTTHSYGRDAQGNILGFMATYKKESNLTDLQVTEMEKCGNTTNGVVLTFEGTATNEQLDAITNTLEEEKVGAIFFPNILVEPKLSQEKIDELRKKGFWVGSGGGTTDDLTNLSEKEIEGVIKSGDIATLYRPTAGATKFDKQAGYLFFDERVKKIADGLGKNVCTWTLDSNGQNKESVKAEDIVATVTEKVTELSVIRMDSREPEAIKALPGVIAAIREKGLNICTSSGPTSSDFSKTPICK